MSQNQTVGPHPSCTVDYTVVDSFTSHPFHGNPASVIILEETLSDETMQLIAREFNLSETAFLIKKSADDANIFHLRWFTPAREVPLCGHATLCCAKVLFHERLVPSHTDTIYFETMTGTLEAKVLSDGRIELTFPAGELHPVPKDIEDNALDIISHAIGRRTAILDIQCGSGETFDDWLLVRLDDAVDLQELDVKTNAFERLNTYITVILTNEGTDDVDFVSRVFAPLEGIPEDPVTGAAHCLLAPYWAQVREGTRYSTFLARQVSKRQGEVEVAFDQEKQICYLRGEARIMGCGRLFL